jgi:hypothetical protein
MWKVILAALVAIVAAMATFLVVEQIGTLFFPFPTGLNFEDKVAVKQFMENRPWGAYAIVLLGWFLGSTEAGFFAQRISKQEGNLLPTVIGVILTASAVLNFYLLPHPTWFVVIGILIFIPCVLAGWNISRRMK